MNKALIITTISAPNKALRDFAKGCSKRGISLIIVGDNKTPEFNLVGAKYLSIEQQRRLNLEYASLCPENHYVRKNIGYLEAIRNGADIIIETDDDNLPYESFWNERKKDIDARFIDQPGWLNIYSFYSKKKIWPRGFPLEYVNVQNDSTQLSNINTMCCPIQQGLADQNPDVDSIYRMVMELPIQFEKNGNIVLQPYTWCPFNSQNTTWFKEAFPLLYLPSHCSFRMTDIWRSFIAQRIAWTCNWGILFHDATVWQDRNEHDLVKDFMDEIPGYLNNDIFRTELDKLKLAEGVKNIPENMLKCYHLIIKAGFIEQKEIEKLNAWLIDLNF